MKADGWHSGPSVLIGAEFLLSRFRGRELQLGHHPSGQGISENHPTHGPIRPPAKTTPGAMDLSDLNGIPSADVEGMHRVFVNGIPTVVDNEPTDHLPGTVLKSGRDTYTVAIPADA